jgi:hypothetical protein
LAVADKVGFGRSTTYFAELDWVVVTGATFLIADLLAGPSGITAMALTVSVTATVMGPAYIGEVMVGAVPLVV